jgi:peptidoglycan/LPS O-acetylase OafA/YrhL
LWLLGAGVSLLPRSRTLSRPGVLHAASMASALACGFVLVAIRFDQFSNPIVSDYCLGICVALLVYFILHYSAPAASGNIWHASDALAAMSYTLYLAHMPVLMFVAGVVRRGARLNPTAMPLLFYSVVCMLVVLYAWAISRCTEAHTGVLRRYLMGLLRVRDGRPAPGPRVELRLEPQTRD